MPHPRPRAGHGDGQRRPIERVVVFARLPNPTLDYYLTARLEAPGMPPSVIVDIRDETLGAVDPVGTFVIVCRYATARLVTWVERHASSLAGVGYFTDDDLGAVITGSEAKLGYRLFLWWRGLAPLRRLNPHIDVVWTSTPALAEALHDPRIRVLPPAPHPTTWKSVAPVGAADDRVRIVYHATGVHVREHRFLVPIVAAVLAARPQAVFEVVVDERTERFWRGLDRVEIRRPVSWSEYLARTRDESADIALVPLLPSQVNRTRAGTKRIDVVRLGAAGVFSASLAYGDADEAGEIRLANRRRLWILTILRLVDDAPLRKSVAAASHDHVVAMAKRAAEGVPEVLRPDPAAVGNGGDTPAPDSSIPIASAGTARPLMWL